MQNEDRIIQIVPPKLCEYQRAIIDSKARFTVTTAATKIGKTFSHSWWIFNKAADPPKPGANYWWVAPVYSQGEIAFNRMRRFLGHSSDFRINLTKMLIETPVDSFLHYKSAQDPDALYGEDVYAAVFDEFTRAKEAAWIALRSTLTATKGECKFIGNAKGRKNWGYRLALKAKGKEPGYEYFKVTAYDAVREGILSLEEVEQAKRDLPKSAFDELYLAEELEDQANPFGISFIQKCIKPISTKSAVVFGVDLAKSVDWTVVVGLDDAGNVCFFDRWQSDWGQTKRRIISIVGPYPAYIDSTGIGDAIVEDIQRSCGSVEGFIFSSTSKQQIMEGLAAGIQNNKISVLDGIMKDELDAFEFVYSRSGVKYSAPDGVHDDSVCALALAFHKYKSRPTGPILTFHR
jgi:hypothetical protein